MSMGARYSNDGRSLFNDGQFLASALYPVFAIIFTLLFC